MSLARHLLPLAARALVDVGAAALAVWRTHAASAAREAVAAAQSESIARELRAKRDALALAIAAAIASGQAATTALDAFAAALLAPLTDASAGYCAPGGMLLVRQAVVSRKLDTPAPLPRRATPGLHLAKSARQRASPRRHRVPTVERTHAAARW